MIPTEQNLMMIINCIIKLIIKIKWTKYILKIDENEISIILLKETELKIKKIRTYL